MNENELKAFISHSHVDGVAAKCVKDALDELGVSSFLASDTLEVGAEWRQRILKELDSSDIFVALLSKNFKDSQWCDQEAGIAVARREDVLIVPFSLEGTMNPAYGFLSHFQIKRLPQEPLDALLEVIVGRFPDKTVSRLVEAISGATSFPEADRRMERVVKYRKHATRANVCRLYKVVIQNYFAMNGSNCLKYFQFLRDQHPGALSDVDMTVLCTNPPPLI